MITLDYLQNAKAVGIELLKGNDFDGLNGKGIILNTTKKNKKFDSRHKTNDSVYEN